MWIKEVIIEGFKSYASREVISGFDRSFNAITGLNGTGKSNILDAICFVLGITNLSQVRVSNLQQLVYKQGQAGVTKASVTIVWNNEDPKQSPVGWEQHSTITVTRQVVIGGRNKYLINGHTAQANTVQNLFHSVQLNVNNPHFLIMQGKIMQVLHMKPPEILSMIEEAAGTRMFETKKQSALRTIAKKDKKLEQMQSVLNEEIIPTMEKLRKDRDTYMSWINNKNEREQLSRFVIAWSYTQAQNTLQRSEDELRAMERTEQDLKEEKNGCLDRLTELKAQIENLSKKKEKKMKAEFAHLEKEVNDLSKELVEVHAILKNKKDSHSSETKQKAELEKQIKELEASLEGLAERLSKEQKEAEAMEEQTKKLSNAYTAFQTAYTANNASLAANAEEGGGKTLADQLMDAKRMFSECETLLKSGQLKREHLTRELAKKKKQLAELGGEFKAMQAEAEDAKAQCASVEKEIAKLGYDDQIEKELHQAKAAVESSIVEARDNVDQLSARLAALEFQYTSPSKNFDRTKVKGLVANLITLKDATTATALEVVAGGRLYNVVVDTEVTGKELLQHGRLKRRVTIIPLNKIAHRSITPQVIQKAKQLVGPTNVVHALELVGYDDEVDAAMRYVFGSALVCKDAQSAKTVTFNKDIRTRSVTIEGDEYDPRGTLTGGSRSKGGSVLAALQRLNDARQKLEAHEEELRQIENKFEESRTLAQKYRKLRQELELKKHSLELLEGRMERGTHHALMEEIRETEEKQRQNEEELEKAKVNKSDLGKRITKIEGQIKEMEAGGKGNEKMEMKRIERKMNETKVKLQEAVLATKTQQQNMERIRLEMEGVKEERDSLLERVAEMEKVVLGKMDKELARLEEQVKQKNENYESKKNLLQKKKEKLMSTDGAIADLIRERDEVSQRGIEVDIELKKITHSIKRFHKDRVDAEKYVKHMEQKHTFINKEKRFFGQPGTDFDFKARDPDVAQRRLAELDEQQDSLKKRLNTKVMNMYEKAEEEYTELTKKKAQIEKDKKKLMEVIEELDTKKIEALEKTWTKVNKDFGAIFSTLLKGSEARLEPPEGQTVMDGLRMRVAFGGVWKNLTELSGGQKSLLALSLILSLLLFKPAPMYILDEIDAALDLSHTENIGQMLRTHFRFSQFIIVSLKQGMWKNANVVFKTKFVDGTSRVTRSTPKLKGKESSPGGESQVDQRKKKARLAVRN
ncbi:Structural maintenance of chromosomes protein 2 [Balamuthia mandrillaris]